MFSSSFLFTVGDGKKIMAIMAMGNGGHMSKDVFTGVPGPQITRRSRRRGDARMIARHL
jgi:hypothetical protein